MNGVKMMMNSVTGVEKNTYFFNDNYSYKLYNYHLFSCKKVANL